MDPGAKVYVTVNLSAPWPVQIEHNDSERLHPPVDLHRPAEQQLVYKRVTTAASSSSTPSTSAPSTQGAGTVCPPLPPLGCEVYPDTRFYVVWKVDKDPACEGIWLGRGTQAWRGLESQLPTGSYTSSGARLRREESWQQVWTAWWLHGPRGHKVRQPVIHVL